MHPIIIFLTEDAAAVAARDCADEAAIKNYAEIFTDEIQRCRLV